MYGLTQVYKPLFLQNYTVGCQRDLIIDCYHFEIYVLLNVKFVRIKYLESCSLSFYHGTKNYDIGNHWNKCQEQISYDDLLDALRLSLMGYNMEFKTL